MTYPNRKYRTLFYEASFLNAVKAGILQGSVLRQTILGQDLDVQ